MQGRAGFSADAALPLGALITLARHPWYAYPAAADALEDQQLGGLIMWVPAGAVCIACGLAIAGRWITAPSAKSA